MTGQVRIVFQQEKLEETIRLLRLATGMTGPEIASASARDNLEEILRLSEIAQRLLGGIGEFFDIQSDLKVAAGASETLVLVEPTQRLLEYCSAFRVGALEG